ARRGAPLHRRGLRRWLASHPREARGLQRAARWAVGAASGVQGGEAMMCKNKEPWVFTLQRDFTWESGLRVGEDVAFEDKTGVVRLMLRRQGTITVTERYAWDGCSPKFCVFDILLGTPGGVVDSKTKQPKTYRSEEHTSELQSLAYLVCR